MNFLPNNFTSDLASTTSGFIVSSNVYKVGIFIIGIILAFFIIEMIIDIMRKKSGNETIQ